MKRLLLLIAFISVVASSRAQMGGGAPTVTGKISGTLIDSLTRKPLDYASITLYRATGKVPLTGVVTDEKGGFKFNNLNPGSYKITVTYIGYPTKTITPVTTTPDKPDNNLGTLVLAPSASALKEIAVTGTAAMIENKVDKIVYNAEKDATVSGGNAGDVLRKVPMVAVDQDGNVSLRGSQNVRILINGRPSGAVAASTADAMKMFPADQIKSVEVITSPSAKYDAEGTGGIINIITKKKDISGVSGSISGGVGTRQNNGNANLNVNQNRLSLTGNFGTQVGWPQTSEISTGTKTTSGTVIAQQNGTSETQRHAYIGSGNLAYDFNASNSISSGIRYNTTQFSNDGSTVNTGNVGNFTQTNNQTVKFGGFDWNADFTHKFKKEGSELTFAGQWSHGINTTDLTASYTAKNPNQSTRNDGLNDEFTGQIDYVLPLNKTVKLEAGTKAISRKINSDYDIYRQLTGDVFKFDNVASNDYDYSQDVYSGYGVLSIQLKHMVGLQIGGRVENTQIDGNASSVSAGLQPFSNSYTNFVPSLAVSKSVGSNTFRLSYTKRIQRPSLQYLNPFRNTSNLQYHMMGNPGLSPEVSQSAELNYSTFIKSTIINATLYFRHTSDAIESFVTREDYTSTDASGASVIIPVNLTSFRNIGTSNSVGSSIFAQVNPVKPLTLRGNVNLFTYTPKASSSIQSAAVYDSKTYIQYNIFASGSYAFPKGFIAETFAIINAPRRTLQGKNPSFNMWVLSMNKEILKKKGKIGLNAIDPFNEDKIFASEINTGSVIQSSRFALPFRSFGVNFSWTFGKMNFNAQPKKKRGVNNDDLKQDGGQQGGQGTGTGSQR
ncbi:outer membrane beta-barrel family protein [Hufsiella ginkgonis]|uniref:TonB-dependent receptor n=1 Tax=Hufsiella ginkgonis TaxID=2695274 RepID=A0A7K1Y548_9SPHI|nr:outer membrane beta-barrel family protein [Hufsiella ginkgonis]MXV17836.1 TonB-dependent receptor [Hufsiella ginkgonis]